MEEKVSQARIDLAKVEPKRGKEGKFRKETWRERFGFFRIMWIFTIGVLLGASYMFVYLNYHRLYETRTIQIINNAEAKTIETVEQPEEVAKKASKGTFYTYNAEENQTDSNPYRTASGKIVKDGYVANNCLPFGTKIEVENVGTLEVQDRMNSRYDCDDFDVFKENPKDNFMKYEVNYIIL